MWRGQGVHDGPLGVVGNLAVEVDDEDVKATLFLREMERSCDDVLDEKKGCFLDFFLPFLLVQDLIPRMGKTSRRSRWEPRSFHPVPVMIKTKC